MKKSIPSFDTTKHLNDSLGFSLSDLEGSYSGYNSSSPHRHKYYEVIIFFHEGGIHEIDFNTYPIEAHSIHFISPDQVHLLRRNKNVNGFVISFTEEFLLECVLTSRLADIPVFFNDTNSQPVFRLKKNESISECELFISKMKDEYASDNPEKKSALQSWLRLFLIFCKRNFETADSRELLNSRRSEITGRFKKLLEKEFRNIKSVSEYAGILGISAGHLSETVLKDTGRTAGEYIHDRLILEARRLLYHSGLSIKEIAAELNFEDSSYFSRFFKLRTGTTPEQFRKGIHEKYL